MNAKSLVLQQLFGALLQSAPMLAMNMLSQTDTGRPIQTGEIIPNDGVSFERFPSIYLDDVEYRDPYDVADWMDDPVLDSPFLGQGLLEDGTLKRARNPTPTFNYNPGDFDPSDLVLEALPDAQIPATESQLPVMIRPHKNTAAFKKGFLPRAQEYQKERASWERPRPTNTSPVSYRDFVDTQRIKRGLPALYGTLTDMDDDLPF